jgi:hypothetical protein
VIRKKEGGTGTRGEGDVVVREKNPVAEGQGDVVVTTVSLIV